MPDLTVIEGVGGGSMRRYQTKEERLSAIENALDVLLRQAIEADRAHPKSGATTTAASEWVVASEMLSDAEREAEELITAPVASAVRHGVVRLGEELFRLLGSTEAMNEVLERVAKRDERHYGYRATIMHKRWDGIGSGQDRWWA